MSEREMRELLHSICTNLDRRARAVGRTLKKTAVPLALGTGLALSAGACSDDSDIKPPHEAGVDGQKTTDLGPQPAYMAPPFEASVQPDLKIDGGAAPLYMGPSVEAGPQPDYMAPDSGK